MIYFDNAASTPLREQVLEAMLEEARRIGNPSSLHRLGFEAEGRLKAARAKVASAIGALCEEIVFTSGGTEADNLAIFGAAKKLHRRGRHIITTDSEHPAVSECIKRLEEEGFSVTRLSTKNGRIDPDELASAVTEQTILVSVMHTNNETGAVYDLAEVSAIAKRKNPNLLVFCDAVQGFLKAPISPRRLGVDLMSLSSHKIHGPKGVGALYVKKGLSLPPLLCGGGQERGVRNGTENLVGIVAFGKACEIGAKSLSEDTARMQSIRDRLREELSRLDGVRILEPERASCHLLSLSVKGWRSEVLLHTLSERGLFVSSGSACSSHKGKSGVLAAYGLSPAEQDSTVRLSFSALNTLQEADEAIRIFQQVIGKQ